MTIFQLEPSFHQRLWAGTTLTDFINLPKNLKQIGEVWLASAHPHGESFAVPLKQTEQAFLRQPLSQLWQHHQSLFPPSDTFRHPFPLLIKLLSTAQNLSIQVHPTQAKSPEALGKTEAWYILAAEPDSEIFLGHPRLTKAQLEQAARSQNWSRVLTAIPVQAGDFFFLPAGTIHSLGAGITALEIQESADTTYRLFDFNRIDPVTQNKRDLQVQQGIDAISLTQGQQQLSQTQELIGQAVVKTLIDQPPFTLSHWSVRGKSRLACHQPFTLLVTVAGEIILNFNGQRVTLTAGITLLLTPEDDYYYLSGHGEFFLAWPNESKSACL